MGITPEEDLLQTRRERDVSFLDLFSIDQVTLSDLSLIFSIARKFREYKTYKFNFNKGRSQINAFFEPSTRTMASFDLAAKQLSMDTTGVGSSSALSKGESYIDTMQTVDSMNVRTIIVRSQEAGVAEVSARHTQASVINAGDGWHEHPTQALLDGLTILDHFDTKDLKGRTVAVVGDILHYRPAGSLIRLLKKLKTTVRVAAPQTFLPAYVEKFGITTHYNVEEAIKDVDVVYACRVKGEYGAKGFIPSLREYSKMFGISRKRLDLAKKDAILMHPGPVIRDIDVHSALSAVDPQSHILQQVENGLAIRKALLWLLGTRYDGREKSYERI